MYYLKRNACLAVLILTGLIACGETEEQLAFAQTASCTELAREIGKREQRRDSASIDGLLNGIVSVVADDKSTRQTADIDAAMNSFDEMDAEKSLEQLEGIFERKGCT